MTDVSRGFGTAYETCLLRTILSNIRQKYAVHKVIEYPVGDLLEYSLLETNNLHADSIVNDPDLVWNFCCFEQREDSHEVIEEAMEKTTRYVMIVIQNCRNPGVVLHWIYHKLSGRPWDHGKILRMRPRVLRSLLKEMNLSVVEDGFFDVPWFLLDVYECGEFLRKLIPGSLVDDRHIITPSRFERIPRFMKSFLAHHYYAVIQRTKHQ